MRMTEKNVTKTLSDYESIIDKVQTTIEEMGSPFYSSFENTVLMIKKDGILTVRDACNLEEFELPISYLLDKAGAHQDEYAEKIKQREEEEKTLAAFRNSFSKAL